MSEVEVMITALAAIFVVSAVLLIVANRFSLTTIPFYIVAGILISTTDVIPEAEILELAQWGIAFLIFVFGINVDFDKLGSIARDSEVVAAVQIAVTGSVAYIAAVALGLDSFDATLFSVAAALSSSLVGLSLLRDELRDTLVYGRLSASIYFVQDIVAVIVVLVLTVGDFTPDALAAQVGYGAILLTAAFVVRRHLLSFVLDLAGDSGELATMAGVSVLVFFIAGAELAGISVVVGAFAAGVAVSGEFSHNLEMLNGVKSIRDFFVTVFFVTLGALVAVPSPRVLLLAGVLTFITAVLKPLVVTSILVAQGYDSRTAALTGFGLDQISEFALVLVIMSLITGDVSPDVFDAVILAAAVTMVTSSYTRRHDECVYRFFVERVPYEFGGGGRVEAQVGDIEDHVVVLGYGRVGRKVVETCEEEGIGCVVVENDPILFDEIRANCKAYVFGEGTSATTWRAARADRARLVVSTAAQRPVSERVLELVDCDVILRADDSETATELLDAGALFVAVPDVLASDVLVEHVKGVIDDEGYVDEIRRHGREDARRLMRQEHDAGVARRDD